MAFPIYEPQLDFKNHSLSKRIAKRFLIQNMKHFGVTILVKWLTAWPRVENLTFQARDNTINSCNSIRYKKNLQGLFHLKTITCREFCKLTYFKRPFREVKAILVFARTLSNCPPRSNPLAFTLTLSQQTPLSKTYVIRMQHNCLLSESRAYMSNNICLSFHNYVSIAHTRPRKITR